MSSRNPKLLCYDIACPKRLRKVHSIASAHMMPIQFSVFYAELNDHEARSLIDELNNVINKDEDDVRLYRTKQLEKQFALGKATESEAVLVFFPSGRRL